MTNNNLKIAIVFALALAAGAAHGQGSYVRPQYQFPVDPATGPTGTKLGDTPFFITPYLGVGAGYDDNLFLRNENEKSSTYYVFSPGFRLDARAPSQAFQFTYQGQIGRYGQSEEDDYVDHTTRTQYDIALDRRNFLRAGVDYIRGHEPRGSTDRPLGSGPDKYRLVTPYLTYAFGAPGAIGRIEAYYSEADRRYTSNRAFTVGGDRETKELGGVFYWRVMPKTHLLAEARGTDISYRDSTSRFSGDERRYYAGVAWDATALTTGTFKIGRLQRRFDRELSDFSGTSWEATVSWLPRTYSRFDFYTARQTNESTGLGNFILSSISGVTWNHAWSSFLSTGVDLRYQKDEYQGFPREDEVKLLGVKVGYRITRWLTLGAEYSHTQRDSNQPLFEYDRNLYLLTATASM